MSKFGCSCGEVLNLSQGWSDSELLLVKEQVIENIGEQIDDSNIDCGAFCDLIRKDSIRVLSCPNCKRLWIEYEDHHYRSYIPEAE